ncbi:TrkA family potassium uptake protein [Microbacterium sp. BF1]|uniref:potassium channel family protein n=1 Tax=Microbacterium sp. BF1 TaxID=2821146 RepID=UPI00211A13D7|nr:TrkA family potassium uptake protein [Microbacterium sp. BF1]
MTKFLSFTPDARRIAEADSVAVIGLGRFGTSLALELMSSGTEVLGIDADEDIVQSLNGELTQVVRADSTRLDVLQQLAVGEFDRVVLAIGNDITASILTASLLLQLQVPVIWAKAVDEQHGAVLEQLGVHRVIYPEIHTRVEAARSLVDLGHERHLHAPDRRRRSTCCGERISARSASNCTTSAQPRHEGGYDRGSEPRDFLVIPSLSMVGLTGFEPATP